MAAAEQTVGAGATKTYKLVGSILLDGVAGSSLMTKIDNRSTATTTGGYAAVADVIGIADGSTATFVWSDGSGASVGTHSASSADWTHAYKVPGIPTTSKTLSK